MLRRKRAVNDDAEADGPPLPSLHTLVRQLEFAQRQWLQSRGRRRDLAWRNMLRISKQLDATGGPDEERRALSVQRRERADLADRDQPVDRDGDLAALR
jgi:hypothetical protein